MIKFSGKQNILWDFDGVIMDSMPIRNKGFEIVLEKFPKIEVDTLMKFHLENGGLSRYVKFRYFFEQIRKESVSEEKIKEFASEFSRIMKKLLIDESLLINDSLNFIRNNYLNYKMHIVSGSDQAELRFLCNKLGITQYFISIHGSPTPKKELVKKLLLKNQYVKDSSILIGDSINDFEAARENGIDFFGFNNINLQQGFDNYIISFEEL